MVISYTTRQAANKLHKNNLTHAKPVVDSTNNTVDGRAKERGKQKNKTKQIKTNVSGVYSNIQALNSLITGLTRMYECMLDSQRDALITTSNTENLHVINDIESHQDLNFAILMTAIEDCFKLPTNNENRKIQSEAYAWIYGISQDNFNITCLNIGFEPSIIKGIVKKGLAA
jgi:hypothetical protein